MTAPADPKPRAIVFYSWQSDLPNATNRGFILDALERATKRIRADDSLAVEPVLDRDTQNVPGAPDIAHAIFEKIDKAAAFLADISIINPGLGRPTPNPNVLIELGYALKTLGNARIVLVANAATGTIESLPFDLRSKRVLTYRLPPGADDKPEQRKTLQEQFEAALRAILADTLAPLASTPPPIVDKAIEGIEANAPSAASFCARVVPEIAKRIGELTPEFVRERINLWDDDLVESIQGSLPLVTDFARVADAAAIHNSRDGALGLFKGFAPLFTQYNLPPRFSGSFFEVQFDLPKFVGHELMVTLFAALIGERRWKMAAELCRETVVVPNTTSRFGAETAVTYLYASEPIKLLDHRNQRLKLNRLSLHADTLKERHEAGALGELCPWRRFQDADLFLYLRSAVTMDKFDLWDVWRPWSATLLRGCPAYLLEAAHEEKAEQLVEALGARSLAELRNRLKEAVGGLAQLFGTRDPFYQPFGGFDVDLIGTK